MKAVLLCAGLGTRLGELARERPKCMLKVGDKPLIHYALANLSKQGFHQVLINLHFLPQTIVDYVGDGRDWGLDVSYSYEAQLLGTAGTLKSNERSLSDGPFLVHYGDVLTNQDFSALMATSSRDQHLGSLLVHQNAGSNSLIELDALSRIVRFLERPTEAEEVNFAIPWVNSGIAVLDPEILQHIQAGVPQDLPKHVYQPFSGSGRLYGVPLTGFRCAIDSPARLALANSAFASGVLDDLRACVG